MLFSWNVRALWGADIKLQKVNLETDIDGVLQTVNMAVHTWHWASGHQKYAHSYVYSNQAQFIKAMDLKPQTLLDFNIIYTIDSIVAFMNSVHLL